MSSFGLIEKIWSCLIFIKLYKRLNSCDLLWISNLCNYEIIKKVVLSNQITLFRILLQFLTILFSHILRGCAGLLSKVLIHTSYKRLSVYIYQKYFVTKRWTVFLYWKKRYIPSFSTIYILISKRRTVYFTE